MAVSNRDSDEFIIKINKINQTQTVQTTHKQTQPPQRRKSSNTSNANVSDDLQLAISKMLPTVNFGGVDVKPQVRETSRHDFQPFHTHESPPHHPMSMICRFSQLPPFYKSAESREKCSGCSGWWWISMIFWRRFFKKFLNNFSVFKFCKICKHKKILRNIFEKSSKHFQNFFNFGKFCKI